MKHDISESGLEREPEDSFGLYGALDLDDAYRWSPRRDKLGLLCHLLVAAENVDSREWNKTRTSDQYQLAYELARDNAELGPHYCFSVMHYCEEMGFLDQALSMCQEIGNTAVEKNDIGILRIVWRWLGHIIEENPRDVFEDAVNMRSVIETRHPQVMQYRRVERW